MSNDDWETVKNIEEKLELPKDFIPCPKSVGSKEYICPVCLSLLNEVTDNVCPSCGREMAWQKVKDMKLTNN